MFMKLFFMTNIKMDNVKNKVQCKEKRFLCSFGFVSCLFMSDDQLFLNTENIKNYLLVSLINSCTQSTMSFLNCRFIPFYFRLLLTHTYQLTNYHKGLAKIFIFLSSSQPKINVYVSVTSLSQLYKLMHPYSG